MIAPLSLCLFLLASLGCQARPNSPSGPINKGGGDQPLSRLHNIKQYLEDLNHTIRQIPVSKEDFERQAESKKRQMELLRQQVYEALAPSTNRRLRPDGWDHQTPSGSGTLVKPQILCQDGLLTCLQAAIPVNVHQDSSETPKLKFPCQGHDCSRGVLAKPIQRPTFTSGEIGRNKNPCKYNQAGCHQKRIVPTYAPIRFNKLPTRSFMAINSPTTTASFEGGKQHLSTTQSQEYFTLPEKLFNLAVKTSTTSSINDTAKPKNLRDDTEKLESEILGITEKQFLNHGLKTELSMQNTHSSDVSNQPDVYYSGNGETIQPYYKATSHQTNASILKDTLFSNISLTKDEGYITISETVEDIITATKNTAFDEVSVSTQVSSNSKDNLVKPTALYGHVSRAPTISSASDHTNHHTAIHGDLMSTTANPLAYSYPKILNTEINSKSTKIDQDSKIDPFETTKHFPTDSLISPNLEYSTKRGEFLWTTQPITKNVKLDKETTAEPDELFNFSPGPSIYITEEYTTIKSDLAVESTWKIKDSTIRVEVKENTDSNPSDIETPTHRYNFVEDVSQPLEIAIHSDNFSRGVTTNYLTNPITENSSTLIKYLPGNSGGDTGPATENFKGVEEANTTRVFLENITQQFDTNRGNVKIVEQATKDSKSYLTTNVPGAEENTGHFPMTTDENSHHIDYGVDQSIFYGLGNGRDLQDDVWKFTSELDNNGDTFSNDEGEADESNEEISHGHRSKRANIRNSVQPHIESLFNTSTLPFTGKNSSVTFNFSNIAELLPLNKIAKRTIRIMNASKTQREDNKPKTVAKSFYEFFMSLIDDRALDEANTPEMLRNETSRIKYPEDYESSDNTKKAAREKRSKKFSKFENEVIARPPDSLRNKVKSTFTRYSRSQRSTGVQPVSEAAAILALLAEDGGVVQLRSTDEEDDDEYYGYEDDDEYEEYEDFDEEYDDNPSVKELIALANRHRKRKEAKS